LPQWPTTLHSIDWLAFFAFQLIPDKCNDCVNLSIMLARPFPIMQSGRPIRFKPMQTNLKSTSSISASLCLSLRAICTVTALLICTSVRAQTLYVADGGSGNVYTFSPGGAQSTFASGFVQHFEMAFNNTGDLFVANTAGHNIIRITPAGVQSTFASGLFP